MAQAAVRVLVELAEPERAMELARQVRPLFGGLAWDALARTLAGASPGGFELDGMWAWRGDTPRRPESPQFRLASLTSRCTATKAPSTSLEEAVAVVAAVRQSTAAARRIVVG